MAQLTEKEALTIISPLFSDEQLSIEKSIPGQVQSLVGSQLFETEVLVNSAQTKVER